MKRISFTALYCAALLSGSALQLFAADHAHSSAKSEVLLPAQSAVGQTSFIAPAKAANAANWDAFKQRNGEWTVLLDKATGTPHQAFGTPIRIAGYEQIDASNVEAAAAAFLRENAAVLRIDPSHLRLVRTTLVNNRWYVSYVQVENGVEVLLSGVELRIFANGNVMAFGVDYYPDMALNLKPSLPYTSAVSRSADGMTEAFTLPPSTLAVPAPVYVLPVREGGSISYKLVYKIPVSTDNGRYLSFVDAHSGDVVWRYNAVQHASTEITVSGGIKHNKPTDDEDVAFFPHQYVSIGGTQYITDKDGKLNVDVANAGAVTATFDGPYAVVRPNGGSKQGRYSGTVQPGSPLNLLWNDDNSTNFERNMFFHVNRVRELVKEVDPSLTVMDIPINITLDYSPGQVNAYSDGANITFLALSNTSASMADGPSVLYHEYGHSLNHLLYQSLGRTEGMVNMACHEGTADVNSCLLLDESRVGVGVFSDDPERYIRDINNDMTWPESAIGESHNDGQILAAAYWDLRKAVSREYALHVSHFAKYGTPDNVDNGVAFSQWFFETLIADDDDGNLANGTPHALDIITAFNRHKIGTNLMMRNSFWHDPLVDVKESSQPYEVLFGLENLSMFGGKVDSAVVVYSVNGSPWTAIPAVALPSAEFSASIPAQPRGSFVQYYIRAWEPLSKTMQEFSAGTSGLEPYSFLVGYKIAASDKFETSGDWTIGSMGDDATLGKWERAIPEEIDLRDFGAAYLQPGTDHSEQGTMCFVTGARGGFAFQQALLDGTTSMTSPIYDLSVLEKPVVRFYRWLAAFGFDGRSVNNSGLRVDYSTDGGDSWKTLGTSAQWLTEWKKVMYRVPEDAQMSKQFRVKFVAYNNPSETGGSEMPVMKALVDDFDVLTVSEEVTDVAEGDATQDGITSYPNPFGSETTIGYQMAAAGNTAVKIYTVLGEEVVSLASGYSESGKRELRWNGRDSQGKTVAPGMYIVQVQAGDSVQKHIIVRY